TVAYSGTSDFASSSTTVTVSVFPEPSPAAQCTPAAPTSPGYWLAGADGSVYACGDATFSGSLPSMGLTPSKPIVAIAHTSDDKGYWLVASDGGIFTFGDAGYYGSMGGHDLNRPIVDMVA